LHIPKLADRLDDIPMLFPHFLEKACHKYQLPKPTPSMEDIVLLSTKEWSGNIRELKNLAQQFAIANVSLSTSLSAMLMQGSYQTANDESVKAQASVKA
jgi:DNA-binding NtrC family response regulator